MKRKTEFKNSLRVPIINNRKRTQIGINPDTGKSWTQEEIEKYLLDSMKIREETLLKNKRRIVFQNAHMKYDSAKLVPEFYTEEGKAMWDKAVKDYVVKEFGKPINQIVEP